jgi:hypothetical protein
LEVAKTRLHIECDTWNSVERRAFVRTASFSRRAKARFHNAAPRFARGSRLARTCSGRLRGHGFVIVIATPRRARGWIVMRAFARDEQLF